MGNAILTYRLRRAGGDWEKLREATFEEVGPCTIQHGCPTESVGLEFLWSWPSPPRCFCRVLAASLNFYLAPDRRYQKPTGAVFMTRLKSALFLF